MQMQNERLRNAERNEKYDKLDVDEFGMPVGAGDDDDFGGVNERAELRKMGLTEEQINEMIGNKELSAEEMKRKLNKIGLGLDGTEEGDDEDLYGLNGDSDESDEDDGEYGDEDEEEYKVDDENSNQDIDADDLKRFFNKGNK